MKFSTQIKPISYLKSHTAEVVKELSNTQAPMIITQNGEAKLVVMNICAYEKQEEQLALLKLLALGQLEIEKGQFRSSQSVLSDLERDDE